MLLKKKRHRNEIILKNKQTNKKHYHIDQVFIFLFIYFLFSLVLLRKRKYFKMILSCTSLISHSMSKTKGVRDKLLLSYTYEMRCKAEGFISSIPKQQQWFCHWSGLEEHFTSSDEREAMRCPARSIPRVRH